MMTLGEAYPIEQARLRELLVAAQAHLPNTRFYCIVIEDLLRRADRASIEQNLREMIVIYHAMKEIEA
jgi:hypothetical protein